ncbi:hypothetical protein VP01_2527g5 [Puccinia sorghi]|uniref:Tc1-like transposase DDE domain-containing protein n=1 Tax=Puccinia sorghi TaxID=27349 RepID=A0A0L6V631_9BASI|nr:hypothetical protein VP01_2527g5 [Puccinia sorghi]
MAEHICEEFDISVTQIPCKWNKASFLQQQHDYLGHKLLNKHGEKNRYHREQHLQLPPPAFLPKYSPFLNPIELAFNILETRVKHTKICSQSDLVQAIQLAITEKMTAKICQKSFLHCQKFYQTCTHMQLITGNIIKDPENFFQVPQLS